VTKPPARAAGMAVLPVPQADAGELATRIAAEPDHDKFTALVKEFNELLDGKQASQEVDAKMKTGVCSAPTPLSEAL